MCFPAGKAISGFVVEAVDGIILNLMEDVHSWQPGDQVIVSSTDYSMYQAEEFTLLPCPECNKFQVKVKGTCVCDYIKVIFSSSLRVIVF